jgi:hypothetical protein
MGAILEMIDEHRNRWLYLSAFVVTCLLSYYAIELIGTLPKPETFMELVKFYFKSPFDYFEVTLISMFAFLFCAFVSAISIRSAYIDEQLSMWSKILLVAVGISVLGFGVYFLIYFSWLLIVLSVIALFAWASLSDEKAGRRRRRRRY